MKNSLTNDLQRYRLIILYDNSKTLSENLSEIDLNLKEQIHIEPIKPGSDYLGPQGEFMRSWNRQNPPLDKIKSLPEPGCEGVSEEVKSIYKELERASDEFSELGTANKILSYIQGSGTQEERFVNAIKRLNSITQIEQLQKYFKCHKDSFWKYEGKKGNLRGLIFFEFDINDKDDRAWIDQMKKHLLSIGYDLILPRKGEWDFGLSHFDYFQVHTIHGHTMLDLISIASYFTGPYGKIIAFVLELANATWYLAEGFGFEAGLRYAFALLPGHELAQKIPLFAEFEKRTILRIVSKFRKYSSTEKIVTKSGKIRMTAKELEILDRLETYAPYLRQMTQGRIFMQAVYLGLEKNLLWQTVRFIKLYNEINPLKTALTITLLKVYGISWTYKKLAKYMGLNGEQYPNNEQGFIKFLDSLNEEETSFIFDRYDNKTKKGYASSATTETHFIEFVYDNNKKSFINHGLEKKLKESTSVEVTEEIKKEVVSEKAIGNIEKLGSEEFGQKLNTYFDSMQKIKPDIQKIDTTKIAVEPEWLEDMENFDEQ